jgi:hypothetical protein
MGDDDEYIPNSLDADDYATAIHEAGHAVVAHALGATVLFVEIDLTNGGGSTCANGFTEAPENLAVHAAGGKAEQLFDAPTPKSKKRDDHARMRHELMRLPKSMRRAALADGYRLADEKLKASANEDVVREIANRLLDRRFSADTVRIEGEELATLLAEVGTA